MSNCSLRIYIYQCHFRFFKIYPKKGCNTSGLLPAAQYFSAFHLSLKSCFVLSEFYLLTSFYAQPVFHEFLHSCTKLSFCFTSLESLFFIRIRLFRIFTLLFRVSVITMCSVHFLSECIIRKPCRYFHLLLQELCR